VAIILLVSHVISHFLRAQRDWSYHTELRVWFQRLPGTTPIVKAVNYETGAYIYFDIQQWKDKTKTNFQMEYDKLYSPQTTA
jgi:CCR4-NOT transcriptional regulation complex NOT5 subunit